MDKPAPQLDDIYQQALAWHAAVGAPSVDTPTIDWDDFTLWLEAAAEHRDAYDAIAAIDDELMTHQPALAAILRHSDGATSSASALASASASTSASTGGGWWRARRLRWGAGLTALAAAVPLVLLWQASPTSSYASGAASQRIALADGSTVVLAPRSALVIADANAITMQRGAAYFDIVHRPGRLLTITANGYRISDIGTTFDVNVADGNVLTVAVADGRVAVRHAGLAQAVTVHAGQRLSASRSGAVGVSAMDSADVASWRTGQLIYTNASLALVAADIARHSGVAVAVDPAIADRSFSGVLATADGPRMVNDLALIMQVAVVDTANGVRLAPRSVR